MRRRNKKMKTIHRTGKRHGTSSRRCRKKPEKPSSKIDPVITPVKCPKISIFDFLMLMVFGCFWSHGLLC
jgi:hypothetical protein